MYLTYIGHNYVHDLDFEISRPKGSGDYLALLIKSSASFTLSGEVVITPPNTFLLYKEGTPQYYRAYGEPFANDWFHFKLDHDEEDFFANLQIPFETPIVLDNPTYLSTLIKNMSNEKYLQRIYTPEVMTHYMKIFFFKVAEAIQFKESPNTILHYDKMSVLRSKIYNRPYEKWCVNGLAHEVRLSPYYFQRLYKKIFGLSCMTDIINARMEYAKYYLTQTNLSIKYISDISGYENSEHFMRQFKSLIGVTPSEYRKQNR